MTAPSLRHRLAAWIQARGQLFAILGFFASIVLFAVDLPGHADRGSWGDLGRVAAYNWWPVLLVLAVGFFARGRTLYHALVGWFSGYFLAVAISILILDPTGNWLGEDSRWQISVFVPVIEELAKALPILLVYATVRTVETMKPTVTDFAVFGLSVGGGFAFHEDAVFSRVASAGWEGWGLLIPALVQEPVVALGHAGWTGLVGLGVGVALARRGRPLAWVVALAAYGLVVVDHALVNDQSSRAALLDGRLAIYVLIAGIAAAIIFETRVVVASAGGATGLHRGVRASLAKTADGGNGPEGSLARWQRFVFSLRVYIQHEWARRTGANPPRSSDHLVSEPGGPKRRTVGAVLGVIVVVIAILLWANGDDDSDEPPKDVAPADSTTTSTGAASEDVEPADTAPLDFGDGPVITSPLLLRYEAETETGSAADLFLAIDGDRELRLEGSTLQYREGELGVLCFNVGTEGVVCVGQAADGTLAAGLDIGMFEVPELPGATGETRDIEGREAFCVFIPTDRAEVGDGLNTILTCSDTETGLLLHLETRSGAFDGGGETFVRRELVEWSVPEESDFVLIPEAQAALDELVATSG